MGILDVEFEAFVEHPGRMGARQSFTLFMQL
jgi:hypothetical protein